MTMFHNTLYVTTDGSNVHKDHDTIVVNIGGERKVQVPILHLSAVVCLARATVTPDAMAALAEAGAHVAFFTTTGRFQARVEGMPGGNVLLRRAQFRAADAPATTLAIARAMVIGKVTNERQFLLHAARDADSPEHRSALEGIGHRFGAHVRAAAGAPGLNELRGLEGLAAREYFSAFPMLVKRGGASFSFTERTRRPPRDRVNALLSFGYTLLLQDCASAAAGIGLDPAVGFLHEERPGRLALALDLEEELRTPVVDRLVVAMINRQQVAAADFIEEPTGGWKMTDAARKRFLVAYQEQKRPEVHHGFLDQSVTWGQVPHLQALLLARTLRGDLDAYPPFTIR